MRGHRRERGPDGHPQPRRLQDHAVDGGRHRGRQAPRRAHRQAPGDHQRREHGVRGQAPHRAQVELAAGEERRGDLELPHRAGAARRRAHRAARQGVRRPRDQRDGPPGDEAHRRGLPRRGGHQGGHHGARVLQRQPAPGHQGRGGDRRPRRHPHHQRADGGRAVLRVRQERREDDRRLRLRRRHVRHLDPRDRLERRLQGHRHRGRHVPRRRGRRRADHRLARPGLQGGARDRPAAGPHGAAAPEGRRREGQVRALQRARDGGQPALHHLERPQRGPAPAAHASTARRSRSSRRTSSSARSTSASRRWPTRTSRRRTSRRSSSSAA